MTLAIFTLVVMPALGLSIAAVGYAAIVVTDPKRSTKLGRPDDRPPR